MQLLRQSIPRPQRRWFWPRRRLAWLAGVVAAVAMTLIVVPGTPESYWSSPLKTPPAPKNTFSYYYRHGWPLAFLDRRVSPADYEAERAGHTPWWSYSNSTARNTRRWHGVSWSIPKAWIGPQEANELRRWRPLALLLDAGVGLLVVMGVVVGAEAWLRSRRGWFQVRLIDLLIAPAVIAVPLVWWQGHVNQKHLLTQAGALRTRVEQERFPPPEIPAMFGCVNVTDTTPLWLRRLLGATTLTPWCTHGNRGYACVGLPGKTAEQQWRIARQLRYLNLIRVEGPPTRSNLERLQEMACLRRLKTVTIDFRDTHYESKWGAAETEVFVGPELTESVDLRPLLELPNVESLSLMCSKIGIEHIRQLLVSPRLDESRLQTVKVGYVTVTEDELAELRALAGGRVVLHFPPGAIKKSGQ